MKPQRITPEEDLGEQQPQQPTPEFVDVAPTVSAAGELGARWEKTQVCEKCCAKFFSVSELLEHMKNCTKIHLSSSGMMARVQCLQKTSLELY